MPSKHTLYLTLNLLPNLRVQERNKGKGAPAKCYSLLPNWESGWPKDYGLACKEVAGKVPAGKGTMRPYRFHFAQTERHAERNDLIRKLKDQGVSNVKIGQALNLSGARVGQIVKQGSFQTTTEKKEASR